MNSKALKLFISYTHKDKFYLDSFLSHLSPLKHTGGIDEWVDRCLTPGDKLEEIVTRELESADIVAFLISAEFIDSFNCYKNELLPTLDRMQKDDVEIIPIIVRPCHWKVTPIGKLLAIPNDGTPVSKYNNQDDAWVEVIEQIARKLENIKNLKHSLATISNDSEFKLEETFGKWLANTNVPYKHKRKENMSLEDIYVYPDLKGLSDQHDEIEYTISSKSLVQLENLGIGTLVYGDEQSGKTSLIKMLVKEYFCNGHLPLVAESKNVSKSDVRKSLSNLVPRQYQDVEWDEYRNSRRVRVLFIDDFQQIKLNTKYH